MNKKGLFLGLSITLSAAVVAVSMFAASTPSHNDVMKLQATPTTHSVTYDNFQWGSLDDNNNFWSNTSERGYKLGLHVTESCQYGSGHIYLDSDIGTILSTNGVTANASQRKYDYSGSTLTAIQVTFTGEGDLKVFYDTDNIASLVSDESKELNNSLYFSLRCVSGAVYLTSITVTYSC